ncbi:hypothetical protein [Qipengyuania sp.]|uniref:hypothetical protein n=1 Tax=Qipengyuania sp. TaxID=2004515 RepID=UPI0035C86C6D
MIIIGGAILTMSMIVAIRATRFRSAAVGLGCLFSVALAIPLSLYLVSAWLGSKECSGYACGIAFYLTLITWFQLALGGTVAAFVAQMKFAGRE